MLVHFFVLVRSVENTKMHWHLNVPLSNDAAVTGESSIVVAAR